MTLIIIVVGLLLVPQKAVDDYELRVGRKDRACDVCLLHTLLGISVP